MINKNKTSGVQNPRGKKSKRQKLISKGDWKVQLEVQDGNVWSIESKGFDYRRRYNQGLITFGELHRFEIKI
jgi:hypothetical protein